MKSPASLPSITLIISTYNWSEALHLIFQSIARQKDKPDEVIIADDGSDERTKKVVDKFKRLLDIPVIHLWQPDNGYHKTVMSNKAIAKASSDYIVQIDHDVVLHKYFIKDHRIWAKKGCFVRGVRAKLSKEVTEKLIRKQQVNFNFLQVYKNVEGWYNMFRFLPIRNYFDEESDNPWNIRGSNLAYWKSDALAINGYNNNVAGWGHDDSELASRLINLGVKKRSLRFAAVQYHLYHEESSKTGQSLHFKWIKNNIKEKIIKSENGIQEVL